MLPIEIYQTFSKAIKKNVAYEYATIFRHIVISIEAYAYITTLRAMIRTDMPASELLTEEEILRRVFRNRIRSTKFGEMRRKGLIPYVKLGHRTLMYEESAVRRHCAN